MAGFERSVHIERSPEDVWAFFVDPRNARAWNPEIVEFEPLGDGPVRQGSRFRETRRMGKSQHTATLEITAFEEGRLYAGTVEEKGVRGTYTFELSADGDGTRVDLVAEVTARGMAKLMVPMVVGMMKKQDGDQLERLKAAVEAS